MSLFFLPPTLKPLDNFQEFQPLNAFPLFHHRIQYHGSWTRALKPIDRKWNLTIQEKKNLDNRALVTRDFAGIENENEIKPDREGKLLCPVATIILKLSNDCLPLSFTASSLTSKPSSNFTTILPTLVAMHASLL